MSFGAKLRHRVQVQTRVDSLDSSGNQIVSWSNVGGLRPASVEMGPGNEQLGAATVTPRTDARIELRWFAGLTADHRVLWDGRIFGITECLADKTARFSWFLKCTESKANGQ